MSWLNYNLRNRQPKNYNESEEKSDSDTFDSPLSGAGVSPPPGTPADESTLGAAHLRNVADRVQAEQLVQKVTARLTPHRQRAKMPDPPPPTPFDRSTGTVDADVYKKLSTLTNKFTSADPKFWFSNFERSIKHFGVKSQLTKLEALINLLTPEVTQEVKSIIELDEEERGDTP